MQRESDKKLYWFILWPDPHPVSLVVCYTRRSLATALLAAFSPLSAQNAKAIIPANDVLAARIDEYVLRLESLGYSGGVLVVRDGKTVLQRSYGFADRAAGVRADTATVYNLGSITKQFTAAAILRLEELGRLRTTDSIGRFFADAPADKRGITLHQLLTHTAGFESDYSPTDYEPTTREEYVSRLMRARLRSAPGTKFFYANAGYSLLAAIVEKVTGQDYEVALRELVLRPAGMLETGYKAPHWDARRIAHGYQDGRDWGTIVDRIAPDGAPYWELRGNGGLHTTLGDIARWDAALRDNRVLTDSSRRKYMAPYVNEGPEGRSQYAYGWSVTKTPRGTRLVTHNGGNGIYAAELLRFVDEGITIFLTSTSSDAPASPVVWQLERIAFGASYELPPKRMTVSASSVSAVAGSYRFADGSRLVLRARGEKLLAEAVGQMAYQLMSSGDTASAPRAAALNVRATAMVNALVNGNVGPLRAALDERPDSASLSRDEADMMAGRRERFGEFRSVEVLGTVRGEGGDLETTVRLNFANGGATNIYAWSPDGHIVDVRAKPWQPVELIPVGDGEFRTFSMRSGGGLRLRAEKTPLATAVVVDLPRGPMRLAPSRP